MSLEVMKLWVELLSPVGGVLLFAWHQSRKGGVTSTRMETNEKSVAALLTAGTALGEFKATQTERNKYQDSFNERIESDFKDLRRRVDDAGTRERGRDHRERP